MNARRVVYGSFLVGTLLLGQSCMNLDSEVYDQASADNFPSTQAELNAVIGSAYAGLRGYNGDVFNLQEVTSDEVVVPTRGPDWFDDGAWQNMARHSWTPVNPGAINGAWSFCYSGIANVNLNLTNLQGSTTPGIETTIAELRSIRAFYYYLLMDMFGRVPLITETSPSGSPEQVSRQEIFTFVENELKAAIPNLPNGAGGANYGRFTRGAGNALLAKVYLNAAVYTGTARWADALAATDAVINSGLYGLVTNFFDNFAVQNDRNGSSREVLMAIPYDKVLAGGMNFHMRILHYAQQSAFQLPSNPWNGFCSYADFYNKFSTGDTRKAMWLEGPQRGPDGQVIVYQDAVDGQQRELNYTPEISALTRALQNQGVRPAKFQIQVNNNVNDQDNDFPLFRYADVLLMKAEALVRLGRAGEALPLVNQVRSRANLPNLTAAQMTLTELLNERGRELAFEGWRRSDQIRFGTFNQPWQFKTTTDPKYNIFPIPAQQLSANSELDQNPGY
jgi:hypothetical protein